MNEEQQRIAILTVMGWTELSRTGRRGEDGPVGALRGTDPLGRKGRYAPNPPNSLDACADMEKWLRGTDEQFYNDPFIHKRWMEYQNYLIHIAGVSATAAQRTESFLRAIGRWEDA